MKYLQLLLFIIFTALLFSCNDSANKIEFDTKIVDSLIRNEKKYFEYSKYHFNFNDSAVYLNEHDSMIPVMTFFESIYIKSYFPIKAKKGNQFKLVKVSYWPNENIYAWVSGHGFWGVGRERIKGKPLLVKPLADIYGNTINSSMLKGKHTFVKFWFIKCVPCVAEMPDLNKIVEENKNRNDILFISFALDKKEELIKFLEKTSFKYRTLSAYKLPEIDSLKITTFPTHLYVKDNTIQKVIKEKEIREIIKKL